MDVLRYLEDGDEVVSQGRLSLEDEVHDERVGCSDLHPVVHPIPEGRKERRQGQQQRCQDQDRGPLRAILVYVLT